MTNFEQVRDADFVRGEHAILKFWKRNRTFDRLREKNRGRPSWSFLDGPITANNPMGVHHAWGRTYKDCYQRFFAMTGHDQRYQNGFDCQGLWVEVEVEKELGLGTKTAINEYGVDNFVNECKKRVLRYAARQTEQSIRLGYWMDWDDPDELRTLADAVGTDRDVSYTPPNRRMVTDVAHRIVERLGNPEWGGSYFTFSTENNETIWTFLKKCSQRGKIYQGHDVMPWSGRGGSAYSQMEVAEGRKLTTHESCFVRFPLRRREDDSAGQAGRERHDSPAREYLLVWTTTPWTLTSNVAAAVNSELEYIRVRTTRDGAVYYFAKDNLNFQRLASEFKGGFGRPEWKWPRGVPKLKTIAQILKEQGGFEELGTIKGSEMVGWEYDGPFDDLPAQQLPGGFPENESLTDRTAISCHRVIDGGRDNKGNPHVVAGEGTGIVHIAPGCGDIDHRLGAEHGIVGIAPLREDGCYLSGFGAFTGREAIAPETAELVFEQLSGKHLLVAREVYPHIYPHCWRTGDELVFRLVDEWFINMDWRDEIKDVARQIRWLPDSIDGQQREIEWLSNMADWMISKKRFWGLALPVWVDADTGDFEVIGSLNELQERAVEGWEEFAGNTPHRPWIDRVKIRNPANGNLMSRIEDVGNPWLDAGIVPFSTMHYNTDHDEWQKWFPADLVTECFPGQFRNWFYSLLTLATMMRYDETDDPTEKRPFKTLFGHRLVMDEDGQPMHKTDGTAIWFEEAAEQLGVDTIRWMYLAQNPAIDLRFGRRYRDQPVTLETPDGPVTETKEGIPICRVDSKPADEIRRQILIPLWNSYAFFVNYARLDEFDPTSPPVPLDERTEGDRWILSNLQAFLKTANQRFTEFDAAAVCAAAARFIDDLSNWYIRRNRRRFWRSKDASDIDKTAAYQTLYDVLVTFASALAPVIPFLTERVYQNLVRSWDETAPESAHLRDYPQPDDALLDPALNRRAVTGQQLVRMAHKLRDESGMRVRQPLPELRYACSDEAAANIEALNDVLSDELNVKQLTRTENLDGLVSYSYKPNLRTLGPKYGRLLGEIRRELPELGDDILSPLRRNESVTVQVAGSSVTLDPDDVLISTDQADEWVTADERGLQIALSTSLIPELIREGMARDFNRHVQQLRKDADLEIQNRIRVYYSCESEDVRAAIAEWDEFIRGETLADSIEFSESATRDAKPVAVSESKVWIRIERSKTA